MPIRTVITMGFGNGIFAGSVNLLPTIGYISAILPTPPFILIEADSSIIGAITADSAVFGAIEADSCPTGYAARAQGR